VRLSGVADDPQLAEFCRVEWPRLVGSLGLYVGDRELAEDLAQEALIRVCANWPRVRDADSPSAWAHRAAFNLAKSHHRREATWRRLRPRAVAPVEVVQSDGAAALAIRDAVAALPEPQRQALVLRYFADLSVRDAADVMGCPENTVKTHTRRALDSLRERGLLEPDGDDASERAQEATP
jgi:RNA polymerase sigma-70 factor (sigma-E family)